MKEPDMVSAPEVHDHHWWDRFGTWAAIVAAAVAIFAAGVSTFAAFMGYGAQRASFFFSNRETANLSADKGSVIFHVKNFGRLGAEHISVTRPDGQPVPVQPSTAPDADLQIVTPWTPTKNKMWFTIKYKDPFMSRELRLCVDADGGGDVHECKFADPDVRSTWRWVIAAAAVVLLIGLLMHRRRRYSGGSTTDGAGGRT